MFSIIYSAENVNKKIYSIFHKTTKFFVLWNIQCWNVGFFLHYRYYKSYRDAMLEGNKKEDAKCEKEKKKAVCDFSLWTKVLECGRFSEDFFVKRVLQCLCLRYDIWNCGIIKGTVGFVHERQTKDVYKVNHPYTHFLIDNHFG